jgi:hypothetical protein
MRQYALDGIQARKRKDVASTSSPVIVDDESTGDAPPRSKRAKVDDVFEVIDEDSDEERQAKGDTMKFLDRQQKHNDDFLQIQRERLIVERGILNVLEAMLNKMK